MNSITDLLDLEDTDIFISDVSIQDQTKTITLETNQWLTSVRPLVSKCTLMV